jgi:hypothetical protein
LLASQHPDAVLEVGLIQYSLYTDELVLRVLTKLVDPDTKVVPGRSGRLGREPYGGSVRRLWTDDARGFKELFVRAGKEQVTLALRDLRLLPPSDE